jgi:pentatricopeptide repeat protein
VTLVSVISAIAHLGAPALRRVAGIEVEEKLSSALINMYSKCGFIEGAVYVFHKTNSSKSPCGCGKGPWST